MTTTMTALKTSNPDILYVGDLAEDTSKLQNAFLVRILTIMTPTGPAFHHVPTYLPGHGEPGCIPIRATDDHFTIPTQSGKKLQEQLEQLKTEATRARAADLGLVDPMRRTDT